MQRPGIEISSRSIMFSINELIVALHTSNTERVEYPQGRVPLTQRLMKHVERCDLGDKLKTRELLIVFRRARDAPQGAGGVRTIPWSEYTVSFV